MQVPEPPPTQWPRLWPAGVLLWSLVLATRPVADYDLWLRLSTGRHIVRSGLPSTDPFFHADRDRRFVEPEWLADIALFGLFRTTGVHGLMLAKLAGAALMAILLWAATPGESRTRSVVVACATVLAASPALDRVAALSLTLLMAATWLLLKRLDRRGDAWTALGVVAAALLAANCSGRFVALPLVISAWHVGESLVASPRPDRLNQRRRVFLVLAIWLVTLATPFGWHAVAHSMRLLVPTLAAPSSACQTVPEFAPLLLQPRWDASTCSFMFISALGWLALVRCRFAGGPAGAFLLAQALGWTAAGNTPWAAVVTGLALLELRGGSFSSSKLAIAAVTVFLVASGWWLASGQGDARSCRLGWGIHRSLDPTRLIGTLRELRLTTPIYCTEGAQAGMLCWPVPLQARPLSHPGRALQAGRLEQEVLLLRDLEQGQRTWYRRTDGTDGGFHLPLARDNVNVLVIAPDQLDVLAGLSDSNWRAMALDPAGVVLGLASHVPCQPAIARTFRDLVAAEWGESKLREPAGRPPLHVDWWTSLGGRPDSREMLTRARPLLALGHPMAAIRAIRSDGRTPDSADLYDHLVRCQLVLLANERRQAGQLSEFRTHAVKAACRRLQSASRWSWPGRRRPEQLLERADFPELAAELRRREPESPLVAAYLDGNYPAALHALDGDSAEAWYARGWIHLESGRPQDCRRSFEQMLAQSPAHPLRGVARSVLDRLPAAR